MPTPSMGTPSRLSDLTRFLSAVAFAPEDSCGCVLGYLSEGGKWTRTCALDVVVVDVELRGGVGGACSLEGSRDVGGAESVVEDIASPGTIIVEGL